MAETQSMKIMNTLTKKALILTASLLVTALAQAADGKELWEKNCAKCHGADGTGQTKMGQKLGVKNYADAKVQAAMKDEEMAKAIKEGAKDKDGKVVMKPTEGISDEEVKGLVALVRGFKK